MTKILNTLSDVIYFRVITYLELIYNNYIKRVIFLLVFVKFDKFTIAVMND